jgi:hypothetical protein
MSDSSHDDLRGLVCIIHAYHSNGPAYPGNASVQSFPYFGLDFGRDLLDAAFVLYHDPSHFVRPPVKAVLDGGVE